MELSDFTNGWIFGDRQGIVIGQHKDLLPPKVRPSKIEVEFSSQPGFKYGFQEFDFSGEGDGPLELAYALTVHKAQGSEFRFTLIIIPKRSALIPRELIYTALTRHREFMVIFHQGELRSLIQLSSAEHSATARRVTNLFHEPNPVSTGRKFLEETLVHRTARGEPVRSKSEVIIANILYAMNVWYEYEEAFVGRDGRTRYPDFTCKKHKTDHRVVLIEHLGMMDDPAYRARWESKLRWYRSEGVRLAEESQDDSITLLVTSDRAGIDSAEIKARIQRILGV